MKQIENIFSSSKTKSSFICPNPKTPIILDKREKNSLIKANLVEKKANYSEETLQIGDYLINQTIVERKTYSDFLSSIVDKRLFNQIKEMKKYPNQLLILEGFDFSYSSRLHPNAVRGAIISLSKLTPIIYTENESDTVNFLIQIAKQQEKEKNEISIRQTKSNLTQEEQKQFILEGFPGIGPTSAKKLIKKFKTLKSIFNKSEKEIEKEIGKNNISKILSS